MLTKDSFVLLTNTSEMYITYSEHIVEISQRMTEPTKWRVYQAQTQISLGIHPDFAAHNR